MKYNEVDKQRLANINWGLRFGVFTICASILFAWMMYYLPQAVPPLKLFLFPVMGCLFGTQIIFESYKISYISDKLLGLIFILLGIIFLFVGAPWYVTIMSGLFIVAGLTVLYQTFKNPRVKR